MAVILDLTMSEQELWEGLKPNLRGAIRTFGRDDPSASIIRADTDSERDELASAFALLYPETMRRVGASAVYELGRDAIEALVDSPAIFLIGARVKGRVIAVSMFGHKEHAAFYLFSAANPEGRKYSAPIVWAAIEQLGARNVPVLNLGGGVLNDDNL